MAILSLYAVKHSKEPVVKVNIFISYIVCVVWYCTCKASY